MELVPIVAILALVKKLGDFIKQVTNRDVNGVVTQLVVWVGSVGIVALVAQTDFADGVSIGATTLAAVNFASQVFVGLFIGSGGSVLHDYLQARDNSNENAVTHLKMIPGAEPVGEDRTSKSKRRS